MRDVTVSFNNGEIKVTMDKPLEGKFNLFNIGKGIKNYVVEGGNLRLKFELGQLENVNFYRMPVIEFKYENNIRESEWIVEFNGENILEKIDHSGKASVLLLKRDKLAELVQRHENNLIIHGDFSEKVNIDLEDSHFYILD